MIRKTLLIIAALVFGGGVLVTSAYRDSEKVLAQKISTEEGKTEEGVGEDVIEVEEGAVQEKVDYVLPYPGMLPDNKFYFLKMLRDKIWGILIFDEVKEIDWLILMGDKRLAAGKVLIDTGKTKLGVTTIIKGEGYISKAVNKAEAAKNRNLNIQDQLEKLRKSLLKHKEVIGEEIDRVEGGERGSLQGLIEPLEGKIVKVNQFLGRDQGEETGEIEEAEEEKEGEVMGEFGEK